jgi:hypothetical protein
VPISGSRVSSSAALSSAATGTRWFSGICRLSALPRAAPVFYSRELFFGDPRPIPYFQASVRMGGGCLVPSVQQFIAQPGAGSFIQLKGEFRVRPT